jgi:hypothetical protein
MYDFMYDCVLSGLSMTMPQATVYLLPYY